ncbi:hypothetical protein [Kutzneria buriramensis]|uniref:Uncharacterized protein n=1 Tax=Kutzneria buriramensis TaxID=1045776 RepID=A0A3E0H1J3_9PSEU|nr:hypothetical protein [Kutzneria buriramensis]REH36143.1 hypothetical protein BCF44_11612 [Kutzneria buriramensis]
MVDDSLIARVVHQLELAGLRAAADEGPQAGGFAVQPLDDKLQIVWTPSDALSQKAFQAMTNGEFEHPDILHMGRVKHAMAEAILHVLTSAGVAAEMSADDLAPATVEVQ